MDQVLSSATEAEIGATLYVTKEAVQVRNTLIELGHEQLATPVECNNKCATGILNDTVKQKRSKAMDMWFYWLRDRIRQGQFVIYWAPGADNLANYFT